MKINTLLLACAMIVPAVAMADGYPMSIVEFPANSGFSSVYDEATATWTLTCEANDVTSVFPYFRMNTIDEALPDEYTSFCFEYRSTDDVDIVSMIMYKVFLGSATRTNTLNRTIEATDEWKTFRADVGEYRRAAATRFLNKAGQFQDVCFMDLPVGGAIQIRNIRYDYNEAPFRDVNLDANSVTVIEAEDFNVAADNTGSHSVHQNQLPELNTRYNHPCGDYFPIYAWGSVDFSTGPALLKEQYKELWDCGFTITQGTAWPGVDRAFLFDGNEVNGEYVDLHEGTDLMMICKAGLDSYNDVKNRVAEFKNSPRLAGWFIMDEPHYKDFPAMTQKVGWIREFDTDHLLYGNLLNISTPMNQIGFNDYDEYVHTFLREVGTGFLSYDYYPVRQYDDTKEIYIEPDFFQNLEIVAKLSKYYHTSFWAFAHSVASECGKVGVSYPTPQEDHMRVQVFGNLAYGAQGIQYFTYKCPTPYGGYNYYDAPIDLNNEKTPVWYMVQNINRDIHALTPVFLGAKFLRAGHTNAEPPVGCKRLTADMLPEGVTSVTSEGSGLCVSMLQNEKKLYMMVLNGDIHKTQTATITTDAKLKRVLMDGSIEDMAAGEKTYELTPGHFVIYLVSENEPVVEDYVVTYESSDYRNDADDTFIVNEPLASGEHYIAAMGDPSWSIYSGVIPSDGNRVITRQQAVDNWGASFNYTINAAEDITVDIAVKHSVPWNEYGRVAATGVEPGYAYEIEDNPSLNWPRQYAASMILTIDGEPVIPADQPLRPAAPEVYSEDGTEFDSILADKSRWVSTANADGSASEVLYFWPSSGGNNDVVSDYAEKPEYKNVKLSAGRHELKVTSLCYPWHFDNIKFSPAEDAGMDAIAVDARREDGRIFNVMGVECKAPLAPGIYISNGKKFVVK